MDNFEKRVLLTSNGDDISVNIAFSLAKQGCRLVLMGNEGHLRRIADRISDSVNTANAIEVVELDMENDSEAIFDNAVDKACHILGKLDAFVNCYAYEGKMEDPLMTTEDDFKKSVKINFMAVWFLVKAVGRKMRDQGTGGSIVLLSTINSAERGLYKGAAAFSSCLAGVNQLMKTMAMEIGKHNIRVNSIARGLHLQDEYLTSLGKERSEKLVNEANPLSRWLDARKDLASTVTYLISDDSRYMTGTITYVDGGQSLARPRMKSFM
ncbi:hypothetical protein vseg_019624 [Gypsophila vaccaria]